MRKGYRIIAIMAALLLIASVLSFSWVQTAQAGAKVRAASLSSVNIDGDPSLSDMEVKFTVYPDGWVVMSGGLDYTDLVSPYTGPEIEGVLVFMKSDELTIASADFSAIVPAELATQWPFNATSVDLHDEYSEGILSGGINCTVTLPRSITSQFPFDVKDFIVLAECSEGQLSGTITVHILSGFPLGDLEIRFLGNREGFSFEGSLEVIYGTYFGLRIDEMAVQDLLQQSESIIPGRAPGSLYQITNGLFECTSITATMTPYDDVGATVDFEVEISGDFINALAYILSQGGRPPLYPTIYSSLEAAFSSIKSASLELSYAYAQNEASFRLTYVVDESSLMKDIPKLLPETVPPEMKLFIEALLNTTYCSAVSAEVSISYTAGKADIKETTVIEGDLNAELNHVKAIGFKYAATTRRLTPQELFINETKFGVSNFTTSFKLSETAIAGSLEGFRVSPPTDVINATSFKLGRFFSLTEDTPFPGRGQRLKITIEGGSNATHGIILLRPDTVPEADSIEKPPDYPGIRSMVWHNQTLSNLKDIVFVTFNVQPQALWTQPWFPPLVGVAGVVAVIAVAYIARKRL